MTRIEDMTLAELGAYVVTRSWWRWTPGMLADGWRLERVTLHDGSFSAMKHGRHAYCHTHYHRPTRPDFSDPATVGCLLAIADELGECGVRLDIEARTGDVRASKLDHMVRGTPRIIAAGYGPTRAHALAALCDELTGGAQ